VLTDVDSATTGDNNMRRFVRLVSLVLGLNAFVGFAHAHHSQAGIFDASKTIEVSGVIKSVSWRNPHGQILLSVKDAKGVETVWDAETASISILRNRGVDGSSIHAGDRVTIAGSPSMRNRPEILARSVLLPNGNEFTFGSDTPYFAAGKAGRLVGKAKIDAVSASHTVSVPFSSFTDRRICPCGLRHDTDLTTPLTSIVLVESKIPA